MKAVLCPVCGGGGEAGDWLRGFPLLTTKSKCWGCDGKGWVEVSESNYNPIREFKWEHPHPGITIPIPNDPGKCPACGGDRNNPPGTGCPKGSHYGAYCEA